MVSKVAGSSGNKRMVLVVVVLVGGVVVGVVVVGVVVVFACVRAWVVVVVLRRWGRWNHRIVPERNVRIPSCASICRSTELLLSTGS